MSSSNPAPSPKKRSNIESCLLRANWPKVIFFGTAPRAPLRGQP